MLVAVPQRDDGHRALPARPLRPGHPLAGRPAPAADQRRRSRRPGARAPGGNNNLRKIIIDDASQAQNPDPILFARDGAPLSATNTLRGGDTATGAVGVMTFTWGGQRREPERLPGASDRRPRRHRSTSSRPTPGRRAFRRSAARPASSAMNLLNFFNTFDAPAVTTARAVSAARATDCRGANNAAEFERQWRKTVAAVSRHGGRRRRLHGDGERRLRPRQRRAVPRRPAQRRGRRGHVGVHRRRRPHAARSTPSVTTPSRSACSTSRPR